MLSASNVKFIPENKLDIDYEIQKSLKSQGIAAICLTPNAKYLGHNGNTQAYELPDLTL